MAHFTRYAGKIHSDFPNIRTTRCGSVDYDKLEPTTTQDAAGMIMKHTHTLCKRCFKSGAPADLRDEIVAYLNRQRARNEEVLAGRR